MFSSQQLVIRWIEFFVAGALLLVAAKIVISRLRQPADRINLILMTFVMTAVVPLLMLFVPVRHWQLGLIASEHSIANERPVAVPERDAESEIFPVNPKIHPGHTAASHFVTYLPESNRNAPLEQEAASSTPVPNIPLIETTPVPVSRRLDPWWLTFFVLIIVHGLAIAYFIFESIMGVRRLAQLTKRAEVAEDHVALLMRQITDGRGDRVRLLVSREINGPMAFGSLQPIIMIPESVAKGDPAILQFCLKHEWTHIKNGDLRAWGLTWACQFLLWFQPLFWMLRRDLRVCQDILADHLAAGDGPARIEYSALLLAFTKQRMGSPIPGAIALFDRSSHLSRRIRMLLHSNLTLRTRSPRVFCMGAGIVLFSCAALFGAVRLNTADGGAQAAQAESVIPEAQPESPPQETKPPAEKQKNQAEGSNVAVKVIRGNVADQAGRPVAKAELCLPLWDIPRKVVQATADDSGQFEMKIPRELLQKNEKEALKTLWALAPNYCLSTEDVGKVVDGEANELIVKIVLPPQETSSFKIVSPTGDPLKSALVQPRQYITAVTHEVIPEEFLPILGVSTSTEGIATLSSVQTNRLIRIRISNEKFGLQSIRVDDPSQKPLQVVRLRAPARIEGRLIGDKARWICGTGVTVSTSDIREPMKATGIAKVVTDDGGEFVIPAIASGGPIHFQVAIDPAFPVLPQMPNDLYLKEGETMRIEIPLVPAPMVHGTIRSKSTGKPVPDAQLTLVSRYVRDSPIRTNSNGNFEARALPGTVIPQLILPKNYTQLGSLRDLSQIVPEGVDRFELATIEVVDTRELSGTLVGEKNDPLIGWNVNASYGGSHSVSGRTDAKGRFNMKVPEGAEIDFECSRDQAGSEPLPATVIQKDPLILRLTGDPERAKKADVTLTGRVLFDGKPLAGVALTLMRAVKMKIPVDRNNPARSNPVVGTRFFKVAQVQSDAEGRYRLSGLKAGDQYHIEVEPTFPAADLDWMPPPHLSTVSPQAKGDRALPDIHLRKLSQCLAGIVVDTAGNPVQGVFVTVRLQNHSFTLQPLIRNGPPPWATTDSAGRFHIDQLPDEPLEIVASTRSVNREPRHHLFGHLPVEMNQKNIRVEVHP